MLVSICICTFKRPALLAQTLAGVARLALGEHPPAVEVIVIDNDPAHSAAPVLQAWQPPPGWGFQYHPSPVPNIALARNAAVAHARGDWIAMVDDDEVPEPDWLLQLLRLQQSSGADMIAGPVVPQYYPQTPEWVKQGRFFEVRRFKSGTPITEGEGGTCNLLVRAACLKELTGPFDVRFGRTGGEDSLMLRELRKRGYRYVWCDEAVVKEFVHVERATAKWMIKRSFRMGQAFIRSQICDLEGWPWLKRAGYLIGRAAIQLPISLLLALAWLPCSRARAFRWVRTAVVQLGKLTSLSPFQYIEYSGN